jgi:hypothetical protein
VSIASGETAGRSSIESGESVLETQCRGNNLAAYDEKK